MNASTDSNTFNVVRNMVRSIFLILALSLVGSVHGQMESFSVTKSDTIKLTNVSFKRAAALHLSEATILVDYDLFMKHLTAERNAIKKQIRTRERMIKKGKDYPGITSSQLQSYKKAFMPVDSVFNIAKKNKLNTFHVDYIKTSIGNFIPTAIESNQCIVLDTNNRKQLFIIKISGSKKTGQMTAVGSSFYFIPGATKSFLSKMDWVS